MESKFTFRFLGKQGDWYTFRAPTWKTSKRKSMDAWEFQNKVSEWMMENTDQEWYLGNGNRVPDVKIAFKTGRALCLIMKGVGDVIRFEQNFRVKGIEPGLTLSVKQENPSPIRGWFVPEHAEAA